MAQPKAYGIKQFRHEGAFSYVVFDSQTRHAALIDPRREAIAEYHEYFADSQYLAGNKLNARFAMTTLKNDRAQGLEAHAEGLVVAQEMGCEPISLQIGGEFKLGGLKWTMLEAGDCVALRAQDVPVLFAGRNYAPGMELTAELKASPDDTLLYPGLNPDGIAFSLIGVEKNSAQLNSSCGSITVDKYLQKIAVNDPSFLFVDVRDEEEYLAGHMKGVSNIPLSELGPRLKEILASKRVYMNCGSGGRGTMAAKTLARLGHSDAVIVTGGYKAWVKAGYPTES